MAISLREGDRMVAIPGIEDGLLGVHWDGSGLVEQGLGVVRLPSRVLVKLLEVDGAPEVGADYHSGVPRGTCSRTPRRTSLLRPV